VTLLALWLAATGNVSGRAASNSTPQMPACAAVGDRVTMPGTGLGALNVAVRVAGIPATVVAANGHDATFIVPGGVPLGTATVVASNPGSHTTTNTLRICDLLAPEGWSGWWEIIATYRDPGTGRITRVDDATAFISAGELLGAGAVANFATCAGSVSDTRAQVHCEGAKQFLTCSVAGDTEITIDRVADTLSGSGSGRIDMSGCGSTRSAAQTIEITGHRVNVDGAAPADASVLRAFVPFAGVLASFE